MGERVRSVRSFECRTVSPDKSTVYIFERVRPNNTVRGLHCLVGYRSTLDTWRVFVFVMSYTNTTHLPNLQWLVVLTRIMFALCTVVKISNLPGSKCIFTLKRYNCNMKMLNLKVVEKCLFLSSRYCTIRSVGYWGSYSLKCKGRSDFHFNILCFFHSDRCVAKIYFHWRESKINSRLFIIKCLYA